MYSSQEFVQKCTKVLTAFKKFAIKNFTLQMACGLSRLKPFSERYDLIII